MKKPIEKFDDRQKNVKTVEEYSTKDKRVRTDFNKNWIDVMTIVKKKMKVTRYCFDQKHFSTDIDENVLCDRISKNTFKIGYNKYGYVYVIYQNKKGDKEWWIMTIYPMAKVKEG